MVAAQAPSASEYQRAKAAITNMVENDQDLPRCVRLGKMHPDLQTIFFKQKLEKRFNLYFI